MRQDNTSTLEQLLAKDAIRELALLYCRGVDRKDPALLRDLYTADAVDTHGDTYDGSASGYVDFLEQAFPFMHYSGHHVCNHLISLNGPDTGDGEVYAVAYHVLPDGNGGWIEDFMCVRYLDHYRKCTDGLWRFAKRLVTYDFHKQQPSTGVVREGAEPSYTMHMSSLFKKGARTNGQ